jgi:hypothetical protein
MTEPFADEHAPEVAASGAAEPPGATPEEPSGVAPEEPSTVAPEEPSGAAPGEASGVDSEEEVVDGFPVLAEVRTVDRVSAASLPAVQAAAAAATGFVAGAATVALVKRRHARKLARGGRGGPRRAVDMLPIVGSRSFLVDVHVIGKQGD